MFPICFFCIRPSVSHVLSSLRSGNHLSPAIGRQRIRFDFRSAMPLPIFGFLACGVYRVSSVAFRNDSSLWHFTDTGAFYIPFSAVTKRCPNLSVRLAQTLQASQPVLAWTFLTPKCSIARWSDNNIISLLFFVAYGV